jgi:hypothetical protein
MFLHYGWAIAPMVIEPCDRPSALQTLENTIALSPVSADAALSHRHTPTDELFRLLQVFE